MENLETALLEKDALNKKLVNEVRKAKIKNKIIAYTAVACIVLVTLIAICLFVRNKVKAQYQGEIADLELTIVDLENHIDELIDDPVVVNPVSPEIVMDILNSEIKDISELATYEYLFTDSARFTDSKQFKNWNIPFTTKSFTMRWSGVIKAGLDLKKITIAVVEDEKKIIVYVPEAEILSYEINQESVEVLDEKDNIFNKITIEDKIKFDAKTEDAMKQRAIENGLLEKAQESAEMILSQLFFANPDIKSSYSLEFIVVAE